MAQGTFRPVNSTGDNHLIVNGGVTFDYQALADQNDATYLSWDFSANRGTDRFLYDFSSIPASAAIVSVQVFARFVGGAGPGGSAAVVFQPSIVFAGELSGPGGGIVGGVISVPMPVSGPSFTAVFSQTFNAVGSTVITTANIANLVTDLYLGGTEFASSPPIFNSDQISMLGLFVTWDPLPVAAVVSPAPSAVLTSAQPTFSWTYSDSDGDTQAAFRVVVILADGSGTVVSDSGVVAGSNSSWQTPIALPVNVGLSWSISVSDAGSNGRMTPPVSAAFSIVVPTPAIPKVVPTWDSANGRVSLAIQGYDNMLGFNESCANVDATTGIFFRNNCTVTQQATPNYTPPGQAQLPKNFRMSSTAAGNMNIITNPYAVLTGRPYSAWASFKADATAPAPRNVTVGITWYNAALGSISTTTGSAVPEPAVASASGIWTVAVLDSATAPVNAVYAGLTVTVQSTAAGAELHHVTAMQLSPLSIANATYKLPTGIPGVPVWSRGGALTGAGAPLPGSIMVERSNDGGISWQTVRASTGLAVPSSTQQAIIYDYEAAPLTRVQYRATATAIDPAGALVSSPTSAYLLNPSFEGVVAGFVPWNGSFLSPGVFRTDLAEPHSGKGTQAGKITAPPGPSGFLYQDLPVQSWHSTMRVRGWYRLKNISGYSVQWASFTSMGGSPVNFGNPVSGVNQAGEGGWVLYDSGDQSIGATGAAVRVTPSNTATALDGVTESVQWMDDIELLLGGSYVTTDSAQSWVKCPEVPSLNFPVIIEERLVPGTARGGGQAYGLSSFNVAGSETVLDPEGNKYPVILRDVVSSEEFKGMALYVANDAQLASLTTIRNEQRTALIQLCSGDGYGEQRYIQFVGQFQVSRLGSQDHLSGQRYRVLVDAREVTAP